MLGLVLTLELVLGLSVATAGVAPILDIDNETVGYQGTIGERNVLVDLKPHLQIRNIDAINGICSYHVFKPNNEEFPFAIDIKDKTTGEAVIEVVRKEIDLTASSSDEDVSGTATTKRTKFLDCKTHKDFKFLIQAYDCSSPALSSNKVPVRILVVDHDDSPLKFEHEGPYKRTLVESHSPYEHVLSVQARDEDCTNDGYACSYQLVSMDGAPLDPEQFAFKIDSSSGLVSSRRAVTAGEKFNFRVRAFDCLNNLSFVDADVEIAVVERCVPQWTNYPVEILSTLEATNVFDGIRATSCEQPNVSSNDDGRCQVTSVDALVSLGLDSEIRETNCQKKCEPITQKEPSSEQTTTKSVIFDANSSTAVGASQIDDNIEDDEDPVVINDESEEDENNKVVPARLPGVSSAEKTPTKFVSFLKSSQNAKLVGEMPKFGQEFTLSAWLRRPANADRNVKEHVLCGTDSKAMNRHHFGLYFYRGNIKFLLRREHETTSVAATDSNTDTFYPSLWEWQLPDSLLDDAKWHFYEVKFAYPNASLLIDGVKFVETASNSDIIDAYELSNVADVGTITTYVGACYHARTQSLIDFFEGDIASLELTTTTTKPVPSVKSQPAVCEDVCAEVVELNLAGVDSIQTVSKNNQITLKGKNLDEMADLLRKVSYVNKETYPKPGSRSVKLSTTLKCSNGETLAMSEAQIAVQVKSSKKDVILKLEGDKQVLVTKQTLESGLEPFKEVSIVKSVSTSSDSSSSEEEYSSGEEPSEAITPAPKLSKCQIRIVPQRNLMAPEQNNEKIMFLQNLLDDYGLKFEETLDTVTISGEQTADNYETFVRRLTFVILNMGDIVDSTRLSLIKNKKFYLSCSRIEPALETNTILVQVNLTEETAAVNNVAGAVAYKQAQKFLVSDADEEASHETLALSSSKESTTTNPMMVMLIVVVACAFGFVLVFAAIKIHTSRILYSGKRKSMGNHEENPQMEWDDSGLNITENPLETLERKECNVEIGEQMHGLYDEYDEEFASSDEDEDAPPTSVRHHVMYSSEEEEEDDDEDEDEDDLREGAAAAAAAATNLEWDDMNIEIVKRGKLQTSRSSNKLATSNRGRISPNKFV